MSDRDGLVFGLSALLHRTAMPLDNIVRIRSMQREVVRLQISEVGCARAAGIDWADIAVALELSEAQARNRFEALLPEA